jgi:hypothetical protein
MEAMIASNLDADSFGVYMATGSHRGSSERLIFIELHGDKLGTAFDTAYAEKRCHEKNNQKNSVYLSIYNVIEKIPFEAFGKMYLMTRDGRSLPLEPEFVVGTTPAKPFFLYQELCPVRPLVVSKYDPARFLQLMTSPDKKTHVPRLAVADLKVVDLDNLDDSGNIGDLYYQNISHLKACIESVKNNDLKDMKILDRTRVDSFTYQLIDSGIYIGDQEQILYYRMKNEQELSLDHHEWGKSAMIL